MIEKLDIGDVNALLKLSKKAVKPEKGVPYRVALLGTNSIQYLARALKVLLYRNNIQTEVYEGEYDGIVMDILNENSELYHFKPNAVVIIPDVRDIKAYPRLLADNAEIAGLVEKTTGYYKNFWKLLEKLNCHIFQANFVIPPLSQLGSLEENYCFSRRNFLRQVNLAFAKDRSQNVAMLDFDSLASNIGKYKWFDYTAFFMSKQGFSFDHTGYVADLIARQIKSLTGGVKKCLVLDLDNTLWGGVVGDDGYDGIQLDPNNAVGEAYRFFQNYVLLLKERGVILAVCSKNEDAAAREPFVKNKDMILKLEDISCFVANWEDKASNIKKIAKELNIGTDSIVFFDDNPAEREIVSAYLPEVTVIDVPDDPAYYALALDKAHAFDWLQITKEDLSRSDSYRSNQDRQSLESSFVNYGDYLKALEMRGIAALVVPKQIERFSQLINKSNQFNLRTKRYSEAEIAGLIGKGDCRLISVELADKFTDYGLISCIILRKYDTICFVDTWLMSCRVLKRGVEDFAFNAVLQAAKDMGCGKIAGEYIPTSKNAMVKGFYASMGFSNAEKNDFPALPLDDKGTVYIFSDIDARKTTFIKG